MTTPAAEDFSDIARRLKEIQGENKPSPIVTDANPPDYTETDSGDAWIYDPCGG